ncbi:MFS transporter [Thermodesulfobium sp.]
MSKTNFRWVIMGLVFFITVINYVDRSAIAFAMPILSKLFHLNPEDIGLTLGAFNIGYALMVFVGGLLVDNWGARKVWFWGALIWSASIFSTAFATGFAFLFVVRLLLGLAEGPNFPAMNRVVGDWLPLKERSTALANGLVAVPFALMIGGPIVASLSTIFGWQVMFMILGIVGMIWAPIWLYLFRNFPERSKFVNDEELSYIREGAKVDRSRTSLEIRHEHTSVPKGLWKFLLTNPTLLSNDWAFFVFGYNLFFFMGWLPTFLDKTYHMNVMKIGMFTVLPWALATVLLFLDGRLSDKIYASTKSLRKARSHPIWISQLLSGLSLIPIMLYHDVNIAMIFIALAVGLGMAANPNYYATNIDVIRQRSGTALGIMDFGFAVAGLIASTLTGLIVQLTGSFVGAFGFLLFLNLTSVVSVILFHHPDKEKFQV